MSKETGRVAEQLWRFSSISGFRVRVWAKMTADRSTVWAYTERTVRTHKELNLPLTTLTLADLIATEYKEWVNAVEVLTHTPGDVHPGEGHVVYPDWP